MLPHELQCLLAVVQAAFELLVFYGGEDFAEERPRAVACGDQVIAADQPRRARLFGGHGLELLLRVPVDIQDSVAGQAVQAVQFEVLGEARQAQEALEGRFLHAGHVGKAHVLGNQGGDLLAVVVAEAQAPANLFRHADADLDVAVEADAIGGHAEGRRLTDVVQQAAPGQCA